MTSKLVLYFLILLIQPQHHCIDHHRKKKKLDTGTILCHRVSVLIIIKLRDPLGNLKFEVKLQVNEDPFLTMSGIKVSDFMIIDCKTITSQ